MEIKKITCEEERLEFFAAKRDAAKKKFERLSKKYCDCGYLSDEMQKLSDISRELNFYADAVEVFKGIEAFKEAHRRGNEGTSGKDGGRMTEEKQINESECLTCRYLVECEPDMMAYHNRPCDLYKERTETNG
jgi:hypothetical protein